MRNVIPVLTVVMVIVAIWYAAAVRLNSAWVYDQAVRAETPTPGFGELVGLTLCYGFYEAKLIPQFFVIWGFIGYVSFLFGSMLEVLGFNLQLLHTIPGGLWEMSIGVWLIAKGFNSSAFVSKSSKYTEVVRATRQYR